MAASDVKKIYQEIINDVCSTVREALQEEGYDDQTLKDLRTLWLEKLDSSRALEPLPVSAADQALTRDYARSATGETSSSSSINNKQTGGIKVNRIHPTTNAAVTNYNSFIPTTTAINSGMMSVTNQGGTQFIRPNFTNPTNIGNSTMKTANQMDGANDEMIPKKKSKSKKRIEISFQVDGTGPPMGDDDEEDDDSEVEGNDVGEDLDDDDDDEGNEEGREDPNPLCSDDDVSDDEPEKLFETENVIVCQYDKISRTKNKWRFNLKSGVMNIDARDYVFSKAIGEADW